MTCKIVGPQGRDWLVRSVAALYLYFSRIHPTRTFILQYLHPRQLPIEGLASTDQVDTWLHGLYGWLSLLLRPRKIEMEIRQAPIQRNPSSSAFMGLKPPREGLQERRSRHRIRLCPEPASWRLRGTPIVVRGRARAAKQSFQSCRTYTGK